MKDRQTGALVRVSVTSDGAERTGDSGVSGLDISDDGNVIAFTSRAALVASDTNVCDAATDAGTGPSCDDIYVHDRTTGQTVRASVSSTGADPDGASSQPALTSNGRIVVFTSKATNLIAGDTNSVADAFLRDLDASTTTRLSVTSTGAQVNVRLGDLFPADFYAQQFGVTIESSGVPIVVEHATYTTIDNVIWTAGEAALATKLQ